MTVDTNSLRHIPRRSSNICDSIVCEYLYVKDDFFYAHKFNNTISLYTVPCIHSTWWFHAIVNHCALCETGRASSFFYTIQEVSSVVSGKYFSYFEPGSRRRSLVSSCTQFPRWQIFRWHRPLCQIGQRTFSCCRRSYIHNRHIHLFLRNTLLCTY